MSLTSRRKRPLDLVVPHLRDTRLIIIAAEGEKTEKQYFSMFGSLRVQVHVLHTEGGLSSPKHVFDRLSDYKRRYDLKGDDQLWLVVDVDCWTQKMLSEIATGSVQKKFGLAVSNPCFEVWLYLHHSDVDPNGALDKSTLEGMLRAIVGSYNGSNLNLDHYRDHVPEAIDRAAVLDTNPDERWPSSTGTHVYRLARQILELLETESAQE